MIDIAIFNPSRLYRDKRVSNYEEMGNGYLVVLSYEKQKVDTRIGVYFAK